ncbi:hypothetical protein LQ564_03575 [Massilia sp. G4R7]|uniref:ABC transporter permease n=1 Tax=Massilia phyllostachyos TaxID=2898585 RepID=A0ABS8Q0W6_9BURK|nr:hypothetical protein [Massilia phyllostachyos]MCD2515389.1 hypothetical protein [Massilia phyllostachyos]
MMTHPLFLLAANEMRLRLRRLSTLAAVLAVAAVTWAMIPETSSGSALLVMNDARVLYTSSALAIGSATMASLLFSLAGFYLARGRTGEDLRSGIGGVIGSTTAGNALLVLTRWLGAMAWLVLLLGAFMLTTFACHLLRGDGPIQPLVYLQTYALMLLPMACFAASCAVLFDSWSPLMGKGGDLLYFCLWMAQLSIGASMAKDGGGPLALLDFTGLANAMVGLRSQLDTTALGIGMMTFDAALPPIEIKQWLWTGAMARERLLCGLLALLPLLPAVLLFHRFSPDRVRAGKARRRRSPLAILNGWLRPLARLVQPLLRLAARLPGLPGQVLADAGLVLMAAPSAVLAIAVCLGAGLVLPGAALPGLVAGAVAFWGILCSESTTRDIEAGCDGLSAAVPGGAQARFLRQWAAALLLGLLFTGSVTLRWSVIEPLRAFALMGGLVALSGCAALFGLLSRTPRLFLGLFLFGLYVAIQAGGIPMMDVVGFHGAATPGSAATFLAAGLAAVAAGIAWSRRG